MRTIDLSEALNLAFRHHTAGNFQQAESIYRQILDADPNQPETLHLSGMLALQTGRKEAAVELISKSAAIAPDNAETHFHLGVALQAVNRAEEAVGSYRTAIEKEPDYAEAYNNLGGAYEDLERLDEAVASYEKALSIRPDYAGAYMNLGAIYRKHGRPDAAVPYYRKAIEIQPDYAEAHCNLGLALTDLARLDEAVASHRQAIAIRPDYALAHEMLGNAFREQGKLADAIESYRDALAARPGFVDAHVNMGIALNELERFDEAIGQFRKAIDIAPDSRSARHNLAHALWKLERFDDARELFDGLDTPTGDARALECLFAAGNYDAFYERQKARPEKYDPNLRVAAIDAFASQQLNRENPNPFCRNPLDFIRAYGGLDGMADAGGFLDRLVAELDRQPAVWEPFGKSTVAGFQTPAVLFDDPTGPIADLKRIIEAHIARYRAEDFAEDCDYVNRFPEAYTLNAWYGKLVKGGHRLAHIHPSGWLSGVFYIRCPDAGDRGEGAIEFSLWGYGYPVLDETYPSKRHCPKNGDLVLFPSSLFHHTVPFHTDMERLVVAFDLVPVRG